MRLETPPDPLIALRETPGRPQSLVGFPIAGGMHGVDVSDAGSATGLESLRAAAGGCHSVGVVDPDDGPVWRWEPSAAHIGTS
jgi:hypothetical protein